MGVFAWIVGTPERHAALRTAHAAQGALKYPSPPLHTGTPGHQTPNALSKTLRKKPNTTTENEIEYFMQYPD